MNVLPENDSERSEILLATCLLDYFPNACAAVARHSAKSNDKHNPGQSPHWARDKSTDHRNKIARHLVDAGGFDKDGNRHSVAIAWRGMALLEDELIAEGATPGRNAVGSPGSTARQLHDEASAIAAAQDAAQDIDWNACFPTRAEVDAAVDLLAKRIPAESAYLAKHASRIATPAEAAYLLRTYEPWRVADLRKYGIGDVEPRDVAETATTVAASHHPANAEALRMADERVPEDRL